MIPLSLEELRQAIHGRWLGSASRGRQDLLARGVSIDTRTAGGGDLFVALKGENFDGHNFLPQAAKAGCVAGIVEAAFAPSADDLALFKGGLLAVSDAKRALGELGLYHRLKSSAQVIAVTGSNGKTTVKRMIHHILSRRFKGSCSPKSFNNDIGVPLTLLGSNVGDDYVVCEVGTNAPGEIAALGAIARPNIAVITSIGETHLEKLVSLERVAAEKASLLDSLAAEGVAIVWADSDLLDKAVGRYERKTLRFGVGELAQLRLTRYQPTAQGQRFEINGRVWVDMPLPGRHMAMNALAAIAVAMRMGMDKAEAAAALGDFAGVEMRLQRLALGTLTLFNDAYNANPASMVAAADVLGDQAGRRRVMIAGDMRELGEASQDLHVRTGRQIAQRPVDLVIGVGELGRYIAKGAADAGKPARQVETVQSALGEVPGLLQDGDVVLLKGSRAMRMEQLVERIRQTFAPTPTEP